MALPVFFAFSLAFSAGPLGVLNLGQLEANFLPSSRLFANVEGKIVINIHNAAKNTAWAIILHKEDTSVTLSPIKAKSSTLVHLAYIGQKRGTFVYDGAYLESRYPLSTARLTLDIKEKYEGLVYPEPKGKSLASFLSEEETYYGEEKEFDGLHVYDGTQKLSHIHWPSLAKGELAVKRFSKETQTPNLVFDFLKSGSHDEARLSQLCLWVLECEKRHLPFVIQLPRQRVDSRKESIDDILTKLAKY